MNIKTATDMLKAYLHGSTGYTGNLRDAIDTVLVVVETYQKIKQILQRYYSEPAMQSSEALWYITELIEKQEILKDEDV